jgi:hypothetical protein
MFKQTNALSRPHGELLVKGGSVWEAQRTHQQSNYYCGFFFHFLNISLLLFLFSAGLKKHLQQGDAFVAATPNGEGSSPGLLGINYATQSTLAFTDILNGHVVHPLNEKPQLHHSSKVPHLLEEQDDESSRRSEIPTENQPRPPTQKATRHVECRRYADGSEVCKYRRLCYEPASASFLLLDAPDAARLLHEGFHIDWR